MIQVLVGVRATRPEYRQQRYRNFFIPRLVIIVLVLLIIKFGVNGTPLLDTRPVVSAEYSAISALCNSRDAQSR